MEHAKLTNIQAKKLYDGRNTVTKWDDVFKLAGTKDDKKKAKLKSNFVLKNVSSRGNTMNSQQATNTINKT